MLDIYTAPCSRRQVADHTILYQVGYIRPDIHVDVLQNTIFFKNGNLDNITDIFSFFKAPFNILAVVIVFGRGVLLMIKDDD